ncbi:LysM peptidoglycan-binding domain-containing protein [Halobacillus sp. A5]|uniref:LysM peptidoglycan-binding domain-containing protein n=1 Tax=Halobacillus sp. A5 TaxID=2880263 RepID=UPI0020A6A594|nr:LysM peptidoglycan-binding domain-containing protein [Halobacillus sp. A5]MCP3025938.1 LysM peptidoglycan-binding domain-containing protein [Halobacillus sp. A5]
MKKTAFSLAATAALTGAFATGVSADEYKVNKGDTLWSISEDKEVSVDKLKELNNLDSNLIVADQSLQVSDEEQKEETYTVESGDSLYSIGQEYGVSADDLMSWNNLSDSLIYPGDELSVSGQASSEPSETEEAPAPKEDSSNEESTEEPEQTSADSDSSEEESSSSEEQSSSSEDASNDTSNDVVKEVNVSATAYTADCEGCTGTTATGIDLNANPDQKVIAVDPDVIPLGSKVYVEGYGEAIAGDTGGAIQGNKIDLYMQDRGEALEFGRQDVTVQVLAE